MLLPGKEEQVLANATEIQNRIRSIRDTMKITKAMYTVSSMKVSKAKQSLEETMPFFSAVRKQIKDTLYDFPSIRNLYFDNRLKDEQELVKKRGFVVVTGDKGMAGAYNLNILKEARKQFASSEDYRVFPVGEVGWHTLTLEGYPVAADFHMPSSDPGIYRVRAIAEYLLEAYREESLDEVYIIYTHMVNSLTEEVRVKKVLPLPTHEFLAERRKEKGIPEEERWMIIEPSPETVLENLARNYVTGYLYGALTESFAAEESARMLAMQTATNNAEQMLSELSVQFNRLRQAAITQEITEVIGGAKALRHKKQKLQKAAKEEERSEAEVVTGRKEEQSDRKTDGKP